MFQNREIKQAASRYTPVTDVLIELMQQISGLVSLAISPVRMPQISSSVLLISKFLVQSAYVPPPTSLPPSFCVYTLATGQ